MTRETRTRDAGNEKFAPYGTKNDSVKTILSKNKGARFIQLLFRRLAVEPFFLWYVIQWLRYNSKGNRMKFLFCRYGGFSSVMLDEELRISRAFATKRRINREVIGIMIFALCIISLSSLWAGNVYDSCGMTFDNGLARPARSGDVIFSTQFESAEKFELNNYQDKLTLEFGCSLNGERGFYVAGKTGPIDTAWSITTETIPLNDQNCAAAREFALRFSTSGSSPIMIGSKQEQNSWYSQILWLDDKNASCGAAPFSLVTEANRWSEWNITGTIPEQASACRVRFGFDTPNLVEGDWGAIKEMSLERINPEKPYRQNGSFVSDIYSGGKICWDAETPAKTAVKFQISTASEVKGEPGEFSPFVGPDGTDQTFYEKPFEIDAMFVRYKVTLVPDGKNAPTLKSVTLGDQTDCRWTGMGDTVPPRVKIVSPSPTENVREAVTLEITDSTIIKWQDLTIELDGNDATGRFVREKNRLTLTPTEDWTQGVHRLDVTVCDHCGNSVSAKKYFFLGSPPTTSRYTLRDDGVTLIDGKPFFPIGIYAVTKREFNGDNIDEAFRVLKESGFNFAHSYAMPRTDEFLAAAEKYGFKLWSVARDPDERFVTIERHHPAILAWYLADDTASNTTPSELFDRSDMVQSVDGTRLSTQADPISSDLTVSRYFPYVNGTDAFLPEIYPVRNDGPDSGKNCVAETIRDMDRCFADIAAQDAGPKAIWPIIQYFQGWGWKRFPTFAELYAMSFASLIHGANGITWYTYGGWINEEKKIYNYGATSTPERWKNITTVAQRIQSLIPVLIERTVPSPVAVVTKGPKEDPFGQPSVSCLMKRHNDAIYLLTVNAAPESVTAQFEFDEHLSNGDVLFEDRTVSLELSVLTDHFESFGVHIYRLR